MKPSCPPVYALMCLPLPSPFSSPGLVGCAPLFSSEFQGVLLTSHPGDVRSFLRIRSPSKGKRLGSAEESTGAPLLPEARVKSFRRAVYVALWPDHPPLPSLQDSSYARDLLRWQPNGAFCPAGGPSLGNQGNPSPGGFSFLEQLGCLSPFRRGAQGTLLPGRVIASSLRTNAFSRLRVSPKCAQNRRRPLALP